MTSQRLQNICIITTGGTIDKVYFDASSKFEVGSPIIEQILDEAEVKLSYRVHALLRKDSLEMTDADRQQIRAYIESCSEDLILVTHGTDTMAETGKQLTGITSKTIVLTGALSPARFRSTDAVFNVGLALGALQSKAAGVYVCMNGQIFDVENVIKNQDKKEFVAIK